jgi:hypothetical protein
LTGSYKVDIDVANTGTILNWIGRSDSWHWVNLPDWLPSKQVDRAVRPQGLAFNQFWLLLVTSCMVLVEWLRDAQTGEGADSRLIQNPSSSRFGKIMHLIPQDQTAAYNGFGYQMDFR